MLKEVEFKNKQNLTLRGYIHEPENYKTAVIFLHGFPASSQYSVSKRIGESLHKLNFLVLRFDFSGTDRSDGNFNEKLISREVQDIKYAVDFLKNDFPCEKLILIGHSTGAIDAALYAYLDSRIDKLILLGGVGNLKDSVSYDFDEGQIKDFHNKGYITYQRKNSWVYKRRLNKSYYDEFFKLDVLGSLHKFNKPILIVHGENDEVVPVSKDPIDLQKSSIYSELYIINGADHKFSNELHWDALINRIEIFIKKSDG